MSEVTTLDLTNNRLAFLDNDAFLGLTAMHTLDLRFNVISSIPASLFASLDSLQTLRLSGNRIGSLPQHAFSGLASLTALALSNNGLHSLPDHLFSDLRSLIQLQLDQNAIANLSDTTFAGLSNLQSLHLGYNNLTVLMGSPFSSLGAVTNLNLEHNQIRSFTEDTWQGLVVLRSLSLAFNQVSRLPDRAFATLPVLQSLSLHYNRLRHLDTGTFSNLDGLQNLILSNNAIEGWGHDAMAPLASVHTLSLYENELSELSPFAFQGLSSLRSLTLTSNQLSTISVDAFRGLHSLTRLELDHNNLTVWQAGCLDGLVQLEELTVRYNSMELVPRAAFRGASGVTLLELSHNKIRAIEGAAFQGLRELRWLMMYNNSVEELRSDMWGSDMAQLRSIELGLNNVRTLHGSTFESVGSLRSLYLPDNNLAVLHTEALRGLHLLEVLRLDNNALTTLESGVFHDLGSVHDLQLSRNQLKSVPADAFAGLSSLSNLALDQNGIEKLDAFAFRGLSLMYLELRGNRIQEIESGAFEGVREVNQLSLSGNNLSSLPAGSFGGLESLSVLALAGSYLQHVEVGAFENLTSLTRLDLEGNHLTALAAGTFSGLANLRYLQLGRNRVAHVARGAFRGLQRVTQLELMDNAISSLPASAFVGLSSLTNLQLSNNRIEHVSGDVWEGLSSLRQLSLGRNLLRVLPGGAFSALSGVQYLMLDDAGIEEVRPGCFDGMHALRDLHMSRNRFQTLPGAVLRSNPALYSLHVEDGELRTLGGALRGLAGLRQVHLNGNRIRDLAREFVGCASLAFLQLRNNRIERVPASAFAGLGSLTDVDLGENRIRELDPGAFDGLASLRGLWLRANNLTALGPSSFGGCPLLQYLQLDHNQIEAVSPAAFEGLGSLRELQLAHNRISSLPHGTFAAVASVLETLNMTHNALSALHHGDFSQLTNLRMLLLGYNRIESIDPGSVDALAALHYLELAGNPLPCFPLALDFIDTDLRSNTLPPCSRECWDLASTDLLSIPLTIEPPYSGVLGGTVVAVRGPCFVAEVPVVCRFGAEEVAALVLSNLLALCTTPMMRSAASREVSVSVQVGATLLPASRRLEYVSEWQLPPQQRMAVSVRDEGTAVDFRWTSLSASFPDATPPLVSIELWAVGPSGSRESAARLRVLVDGVPDAGHAVAPWPEDLTLEDLTRRVPFVRIAASGGGDPSALDIRSTLAVELLAQALPRFASDAPLPLVEERCAEAQLARRSAVGPDFRATLPPCPPSLSNIWVHRDYGSTIPSGVTNRPWFGWSELPKPRVRVDASAQTVVDACVGKGGSDLRSRQVCCYDNLGTLVATAGEGALLPETSRSEVVVVEAAGEEAVGDGESVQGFARHWLQDVVPRFLCCVALGRDSRGCDRLAEEEEGGRQWRGWGAPRVAGVFGAAHLLTLDGVPLTLNGGGEFFALLAPYLVLQIRMAEAPRGGGALTHGAVMTAVAVVPNPDAAPLSLHLAEDEEGVEVFVAGEPIEVDGRRDRILGHGGSWMRVRMTAVSLECEMRTGVVVTVWSEGPSLSLRVSVPEELQGTPAFGLLAEVQAGRSERGGEEGFVLRNGTTLDAGTSSSLLHTVFLEDWRVGEAESEFVYRGGESHLGFNPNREHRPLLPDAIPRFGSPGAEEIDALCGTELSCRFDATALNSTRAGLDAAANSRLNAHLAAMRDRPPQFVLPTSLRKDVLLDSRTAPSSAVSLVFSVVDPDSELRPQMFLQSVPECCQNSQFLVRNNSDMPAWSTSELGPGGVTADFSCEVGSCPLDVWMLGWVRIRAADATGMASAVSVGLYNSRARPASPPRVDATPDPSSKSETLHPPGTAHDATSADETLSTPSEEKSADHLSTAALHPTTTPVLMVDPGDGSAPKTTRPEDASGPRGVVIAVMLICVCVAAGVVFLLLRVSTIRRYFRFRDEAHALGEAPAGLRPERGAVVSA